MEIGLDPSNSVIKRLRCTCVLTFDDSSVKMMILGSGIQHVPQRKYCKFRIFCENVIFANICEFDASQILGSR